MNELKMKAKAGVTLVELLVVILIVTILSVSLLPLLQPFVTEAQYAAEAIPVIGTIRTKVGMYQYDKGRLPSDWGKSGPATLSVHTWVVDNTDSEQYDQSKYELGASLDVALDEGQDSIANHVGTLLQVGYKDLLGRRSKPLHYQYYVLSATNNQSYVVGCFGDGNGLKMGTGYAVCELVYPKKKYIGVWKNYAPEDDSKAVKFSTGATSVNNGCYVPTPEMFAEDVATQSGENVEAGYPTQVEIMATYGWDFGFEVDAAEENGGGGDDNT